jgi:hypothetical protein
MPLGAKKSGAKRTLPHTRRVHTPSNLVVENGKTRRRKKINKNPRAM